METCKVCNNILFKTRRGACSNCDQIESKRISKIYDENTLRLSKDIPYLEESNYIVDYDFSELEGLFKRYAEDYDGFEENPDFQRGHVWNKEQQIKYVEAFVSAFEDWLQDSYPDDYWMLDKVFNHPTLSDYWEYNSDSVEGMFDIWLNVIYQQKVNPERFKDVDVDYKWE